LNRDYGIGAQILHELGLRRILLLTNHPPKITAIEGFELEVVGNVPLGTPGDGETQSEVRGHTSDSRGQTSEVGGRSSRN
jgi:3,4-dihydroxy 2-butanone 4-phosphate synthase/GTP cyclohydrolase II